jgi:RNA polymerase sigma-70 factor (ECF subfamily)
MKGKDNNLQIDIRKLKEKSEDEFEKFFRSYLNRIYTVVYRVVKNPATAEDLTSEVMMKVYNSINKFKEKSQLSSWVYRIAYNHAVSYLRRYKHTESIDDYDMTIKDESEKRLDYLEREELSDYIKKKLMELPEDYRVALTLYHFEEMPYKEIAYTMGVNIGTVKTYIHRGRNELEALLEEVVKEER